jgi:hypothetical protein
MVIFHSYVSLPEGSDILIGIMLIIQGNVEKMWKKHDESFAEPMDLEGFPDFFERKPKPCIYRYIATI